MTASISAGYSIKVSTIFVHENYNHSTHDFDICILELSEASRISQPVVLPQSALISYSGKPIAIGYRNEDVCSKLGWPGLRLMNVPVWSNDKCAKNTNLTPDNIMCIEASDKTAMCEVKQSFSFSFSLFN